MLTKREKAERKLHAIEVLKPLLPYGKEVYTLVSYVAPSGMSRRIRLFIIDSDANNAGSPWIREITQLVGDALGYRENQSVQSGLVVSGTGMDMGFAVLYELSGVLHEGKAVGYGFRHSRL